MDHMTLNIVLRARIPGAVKMETVMQSKGKIIKNALKCAFPYTIPIFAGFWFLGLTYGVYMNVFGFSFWYPMLMSLTIFWEGAWSLLQSVCFSLPMRRYRSFN